MSPTQKSERRLAIFVDGQNLISNIRTLFYNEISAAEYLPRKAKWKWLFRSVANSIKATDLDVHWYTIADLDFTPHIDWGKEDMVKFRDEGERELWKRRMIWAKWIAARYRKCKCAEDKDGVLLDERFRCYEWQTEMNRRMAEWKSLQDAMARSMPNFFIHRHGWQLCSLVDRQLKKEKGVDVALAVGMMEADYDVALLFSSDGDYVPLVEALQKKGKKVGNVEYEFRTGKKLRGTSRRLTQVTDFTIEIPFAEMAAFLKIEPVDAPKKSQS